MRKLIAVTMMLAVVGLLTATTLALRPTGASATASPAETVIKMGEFYFEGPEGKSEAPVGDTTKPVKNIGTYTGGAAGKIELVFENIGKVLHEVRSPLFGATKEVKVELIDPSGKVVAEVESTDLLELELEAGWKAKVELVLAGSVAKSLNEDKDLAMVFEISCHVEGHYKAGMRANITVKP